MSRSNSDNDFEGMDHMDWIMTETELEILTEKRKMKSRAVEECEKMQCERIALAKKLKDLDCQRNELLALRRRALVSIREAARGSEVVSEFINQVSRSVGPERVWKTVEGALRWQRAY